MTSGRARDLAVDAVGVRLQVFPRQGPDEDSVYSLSEIASIKILEGVMPDGEDRDG